MQVILAKSAGFCYGVKRAVELAQKTAEESNGAWMLGDLIHNTHVVEELARSGIRKTTDPASIEAGETVVIRSHGELKSVIDLLEGKGVRCDRHLSQCLPDPASGGGSPARGTPTCDHR